MKLLKLSVIKQGIMDHKKYNLIKIELDKKSEATLIGNHIRRNLIKEAVRV